MCGNRHLTSMRNHCLKTVFAEKIACKKGILVVTRFLFSFQISLLPQRFLKRRNPIFKKKFENGVTGHIHSTYKTVNGLIL